MTDMPQEIRDLRDSVDGKLREYRVAESDDVRTHLAREIGMLANAQRGRTNPLAYEGPQGFVLRHGIDFTSPPELPDGYEWMEPRNCFGNAAQLAIENPSLTYVEGYAQGRFFAIPHAWVVDRDGTVIDPTWRPYADEAEDVPREQWQYVGVPFTRSFLIEQILKNETYGLIDQWETGYRLLRKRLPKRAVPRKYHRLAFDGDPIRMNEREGE